MIKIANFYSHKESTVDEREPLVYSNV